MFLWPFPLVHWTQLKTMCLCLPVRYIIDKIALMLLFSSLNSPHPLSLVWKTVQPFNHLCVPLLNALQCMHACLALGAQQWAQYLAVSHQGRAEGKDHLPWPADSILVQPGRAHHWSVFHLVSTRTWWAFYGKLLSIQLAPCQCFKLYLKSN